MFTGLVEELGHVIRLEERGDSARLTVHGPTVVSDVRYGGSIAVKGCCLTVVDLHDDGEHFTADVMRETLEKTSLGSLAVGSPVNLERPVAADGRLGGHIVQGHVDGTGTIAARESSEHWDVVRIQVPTSLAGYLAAKGSVAVDGVSLTVVDVEDGAAPSFTVSLIPETLRSTTLGVKQVGDAVNLEVDVIAKYVERLMMADGPVHSGVVSA